MKGLAPSRFDAFKGALAGTLRRAVRSQAFTRFQVDGTWNVPTTLTFVGYLRLM